MIGRHSVDGVRKSLERLAQQGIVDVEDVGAAKSYRLNREHLAADHIIALARTFETFIDQLRNRLNRWRTPAKYAALFGSAVGGEMRPDSDIDLLIVRPNDVAEDDARWAAQVRKLSTDASRWTGNDVRVLELGDSEARRGVRLRRQVLLDIEREGIRLVGPPAYLRVVASRGRN